MLRAILRALLAVTRRDLAGFGGIRTNNFFLFVALLIWGNLVSGIAPVSAYPFLTLLAVLLFFPISSDPMEKIPRVRLALWPLPAKSRIALRIVSLALNPVLLLTVALLAWQGRNLLLPAVTAIAITTLRARVPRLKPVAQASWPAVLGLLTANHLRAMLAVLDTWLALAIAVIATTWRLASRNPDPAALPMLAILVGIALSTQAQSDAGLNATRARLLPTPTWRLLLARDAAYLAIQLVLTAALDPVAGLAFGWTALAAGRYPSIHASLRAERWRFTGGRLFFGVLQMIAGAALAFAGLPGLALAGAAWAASVWWAGRVQYP